MKVGPGGRGIHRTMVVQFVALSAFWFALSQRLEPLFVLLGLATAAAVTALTNGITRSALGPGRGRIPIGRLPVVVARAVGFAIWMAGRILMSSVQLAHMALSPRLPIEPCTLRFRTELRSPLARTVLTNSISMVPGTLTIEVEGGWVLIHALAPTQAEDLLSGRLQNKVASVFLDDPQPSARRQDLTMGPVR